MIQQNVLSNSYRNPDNNEIKTHLEQKVAKVCLIRLLFLILLLVPLFLNWFAQVQHEEHLLFVNIAEYTTFLIIGFSLTIFFLLSWSLFSDVIFFFRLQLFSDLILAAFLSLLTGGIASNFNFIFLAILFLYGRILGIRIANIITPSIGLFFLTISFYQFYIQSQTGQTPDLSANQILYNLFLQFLALALVFMLLKMGYGREDQLLKDIAKKEKELRRSENLKSQVFDWMNSGLLVLDNSGSINVINPQALSYSGLKIPEQALGQKIDNLFPKLAEKWNQIPENQNLRTEISEGDKIYGATFTFIREEKSTLILFSDISKIKEMEERLQQMEKLASIGELAAGLAHEIKNPLAGIKGSLQLIEQDNLEESSKKRLYNVIQRDIYRLDHLLQDFLAFARPSQAKAQALNLENSVRTAIDNMRLSTPKVKFDLDASLKGKTWIWDQEQLEQVLINLLLNAAQASLHSENAKVEIGYVQDAKGEYISILDTGPGFDTHKKKAIFDPFFTTKDKGSGLGLSIAQRLANQNSSWIEIENAENWGVEAKIYSNRENIKH